ncbi:MAG: flavin reductase family protein [Armatimonadetes bacterium]|nr:flavin reductase family protein [Armatimonadota bacterium]
MDEAAKKRALRLIPYTLFVVGTLQEEEISAFTGSWLTQVSFQPPLLAIGVNRKRRSHEAIQNSGVFSLSFLDSDQKEVARHFFTVSPGAGSRLGDYAYTLGQNGCPLLEVALAHVECRVHEALETGDHTLFIGEVIDVKMLRDAPPLLLSETGWKYGG